MGVRCCLSVCPLIYGNPHTQRKQSVTFSTVYVSNIGQLMSHLDHISHVAGPTTLPVWPRGPPSGPPFTCCLYYRPPISQIFSPNTPPYLFRPIFPFLQFKNERLIKDKKVNI